MNFRFPKALRLLKRHEFSKIKDSRKRLVGSYIRISYLFTDSTSPKLGITVSTRFGKASIRNRFKRIVREAFRTSYHLLPQNIEIIILPTKTAKKSKMIDIQNDLLNLLENLKK